MIIISNILKTLAVAFSPSPPVIGGPEEFRYGLKPIAIGACLQGRLLPAGRRRQLTPQMVSTDIRIPSLV